MGYAVGYVDGVDRRDRCAGVVGEGTGQADENLSLDAIALAMSKQARDSSIEQFFYSAQNTKLSQKAPLIPEELVP